MSSAKTTDLRGRMSSAATRTQPTRSGGGAVSESVAADPGPAAVRPVRTSPYKGTFEMSRQDAKRLRVAALEHDTSVTRLVQAATLAALEDPAVMAAALRVAARIEQERT
ncbi:MAG: hypothetical protein ACT4P1_15720 [Sporichthyaceae bacterium]